MKILLVGEYSNVHWTLAEGLRALGHSVTVLSDGDVWKDYPRDINLKRRSLGTWDTLRYLWQARRLWPTLKGYDIVQLINPIFLDLKAERMWHFYKQLRQQNRHVVLGAFGIDYYWVLEGMKPETFRYSDFYQNGELRHNTYNDDMEHDWLKGEKGRLNRFVAEDCDAIVTGLYEYDVCYRPHFPQKTTFIPFPIKLEHKECVCPYQPGEKIRFFIGIQKTRHSYKGTDVMLRALERLKQDYPDRMEVVKAESVPFAQYEQMLNSSHVLLDQLYSYTPGMNGLLAMSKGMVLVGGGEPEQYELMEKTVPNVPPLRPIINVQPTEEDVYQQMKARLILQPEAIPQLQHDSMQYVLQYHDFVAVARQYEKVYQFIIHNS